MIRPSLALGGGWKGQADPGPSRVPVGKPQPPPRKKARDTKRKRKPRKGRRK